MVREPGPLAPLECLLIADDMTGACDAAVHFAMRGYRTALSLHSDRDAAGTDVMAVSTDSRDSGAAEFRRVLGEFPWLDARILFKKIDSMLRGSPAEEIQAAMELLRCDAAVITPSFPAMRRTVEAGVLRAAGIAGFEPIEVPAYFRRRGLDCCAHVQPEAVRAAIMDGARFVTVDSICDRDLDETVAAALRPDRRILWAGSAGLAAALARGLPAAPHLRRARPPALAGRRPLFCIGSDHPLTLEQQRRLLAGRHAELASVESSLPDSRVPLLLRIPWGRVSPAAIQELLVSARDSIGALVISGGETSSLVCHALGVHRVELQEEIAAGIPLGYLKGGPFDGLPVVTKSGAFGDPEALIRINDYFTCLKS